MQPLSKAQQTEKRRRIERKVLFWWALVFSILLGLWAVGLQRSRHESCVANYEAFNKVFKPFKPPEPKPGEPLTEQQENWNKFDKNVNNLKASCDEQVDLIP